MVSDVSVNDGGMGMSDNRDERARQALWSGLRRFTEQHAAGITGIEPDTVDFAGFASVVFEDKGSWCWAVSFSDGRTNGGVESTRDAAQAAAQATLQP